MKMLSLNYKEYGSGTDIIIVLHGFLGSLDNWHTLATEWAGKNLHVYTIDQRNHGRSPHTKDHSIQLMANDLYDFMKQQRISSAIVLGHSMGGKVAMQFALDHPEHTSKLIVADMAPRGYRGGAHDDVFRAIRNVDLSKAQLRKDVEQAMAEYLGDFGTRQFVMKSLDRVDEGHYRWKFNIDVLEHEYPDMIREVNSEHAFKKPVLFVKGGNSLYIQDKDLPLIEKLFPDYILKTIENAGHWLHADSPKAFSEIILEFINSTGG
jgi:esterase